MTKPKQFVGIKPTAFACFATKHRLDLSTQGLLTRLILAVGWDTDTYPCTMASLALEVGVHRKNLVAKLDRLAHDDVKAIRYRFPRGHEGYVQLLCLDELVHGG